MRILQILPYFAPNWEYGGPIKYVYNLSKELIKLGHYVTVFSTRFNNNTPKYEILEQIKVFRTKILFKLQNYGVTPKIFQDLPKRNFDIIHFHCLRNNLIDFLAFYFKRKGIPYVLNAHGTLSDLHDYDNILIKTLKQFQNIFIRCILKNANRLIAVSKFEKQDYLRLNSNPQKIEIIPLGINFPTEISKTENSWGETIKHLLQSKKYILFVGRIVKRKGLNDLIESFNKILTLYPDLNLVVIGKDFGYKKTLIKVIQKNNLSQNVLFVGSVNEQILSLAYQNCEFLVYPSQYEIFGLTPFEVALYSKPSIVSDRMGIKEIIVKYNMGYIVKSNNKQDLFEKMKSLLDEPDLSKKMGENAFETVRNNYLWSNITKKIIEIYENAI